ncbi:hypothetical protein K502DRAFT_74439 [Neoconidiobolus thromboides FSU 785]|nr:hypothetical protein K502DRAFT_74439 [Neoconidiobolus thromboides FSU 785]
MTFNTLESNSNEAGIAARKLLRQEGIGTLSTIYNPSPQQGGHHNLEKLEAGNNLSGYPFCIFDYYIDLNETYGDPILLVSTMQKSYHNFSSNPKVAFTVREPGGTKIMGNSRFCLMGEIARLEEELIELAKQAFLKKHSDTKFWLGWKDFQFYRIKVQSIYWVGGFGNSHYIGDVPLLQYKNVDTSILKKKVVFIHRHFFGGVGLLFIILFLYYIHLSLPILL